jgi:small subunit ribosomal protein S8e
MSISRNSRHKRRATGGRMPIHKKKRKFEMGRVPTMTKLGAKKCINVRGRGGNIKRRALRCDTGNFAWGGESMAAKTRVLDCVYNATNNELVRTKTLVKNTIVLIDATPFRQWYLKKYDVELNKKKVEESNKARESAKRSSSVKRTLEKRQAERNLEQKVADQFSSGRLYACISSRPGQSGRVDGYILEGKELEFYLKKLERRKK